MEYDDSWLILMFFKSWDVMVAIVMSILCIEVNTV